MKSYLNSTKQLRAAGFLLVACTVLTFGCKQANSPLEVTSENGQTIEGLNINVKYAETYDQTEITYSRLWPKGISSGFNKGQSSSGGELLVDYERTHEIIAFDEEGYMSSVTEYLEGDGEMNMPEEAYNELKSTMPARSVNYDPVVRIEYSGGVEKRIGKSGKVLYEKAYDENLFKIDTSLLDSLNSTHSQDSQESIQRNISRLQDSGVNFEIHDDKFALYTLNASSDYNASGIYNLRYLEDLETGETIRLELLNEQGDYDTIIFSRYKNIEEKSILVFEEIYRFGEINGNWGVTQRSVRHKSNLKIIEN